MSTGKKIRPWQFLFVLATILNFSACVPSMPPLPHISELQSGEIVLISKIELVPPLAKFEQQNLKTIGSGRLKDKISIMFSDQRPNIKKSSNASTSHKDIDNYAGIKPGETFVLRRPRSKFIHYLGGIIYLASTRSGLETMILPGGLKIHLQKNSKAIYLGTIRYYRDEYNEITKVRIIDERKAANREFRRNLGAKFNIDRVKISSFKMRPLRMY